MAAPLRMFQLREEDLELLGRALTALEEVFDDDEFAAALGEPKPHHDEERERITVLRRRFGR